MSKLEQMASNVAKQAYPQHSEDDYGIDIMLIISTVLAILEECDFNDHEIAERATADRPTMRDRVRVFRAFRKSGVRGRDVLRMSNAFWGQCKSCTQPELEEAIIEARDYA